MLTGLLQLGKVRVYSQKGKGAWALQYLLWSAPTFVRYKACHSCPGNIVCTYWKVIDEKLIQLLTSMSWQKSRETEKNDYIGTLISGSLLQNYKT